MASFYFNDNAHCGFVALRFLAATADVKDTQLRKGKEACTKPDTESVKSY